MATPNILLCNIPIRGETSVFPPVACTSLCNFLKKAGYDPKFYDLDARRPSPEDLSEFFRANQFDAVGISAVLSTSYRYAKDLAALIKRSSPGTQIILGGNLAVAHEIILRKCRIDICVIGEGERPLLGLMKHLEDHGSFDPLRKELHEIKGISFLMPDGTCRFTGFGEALRGHEIEQPDFDMLRGCGIYSDINKYITNPMDRYDFKFDPRSRLPHHRGKKMATVIGSKGCVNRCAFCHRWIGGYRIIPAEKVVASMKYLKERYGVDFFTFGDECFGEDRRWREEFIRLVRPLDVLFTVGGARATLVRDDPEFIRRLKEVGLSAVYFGIESGSDKILKIMEKNATRADNLKAVEMCREAGMFTVIQLVIGMPGENDQTIDETIEFLKEATGGGSHTPAYSITWLQTLPGTPCYDFLRRHGMLGETVDDEERYLIRVSDVNAAEFSHYMNATEEPMSKVKTWAARIDVLTKIHWLKNHGWRFNDTELSLKRVRKNGNIARIALSRIKVLALSSAVTYRVIDLMGGYFWKLVLFRRRCLLYGMISALQITFGIKREEDRSGFKIEADSLRDILRKGI